MRCSSLPHYLGTAAHRGLQGCAGIQGAEEGQSHPASLCPSVIPRARCLGVPPLCQAPPMLSQGPHRIPQKAGFYPTSLLRKQAQGHEAAGFRACALPTTASQRLRRDLAGRSSQRQAGRAARVLPTLQSPPAGSSERKGPRPGIGSLSSGPAWVTIIKPPTRIESPGKWGSRSDSFHCCAAWI